MLDAIKNIRRTKNAKRVIEKAADLFESEPDRWIKGNWIETVDGDTADEEVYFGRSCDVGGICKVCLEGALLIFAKDRETYNLAQAIVLKELNTNYRRFDHMPYEHPFGYNDDASRRVGDVVKVLRSAVQR